MAQPRVSNAVNSPFPTTVEIYFDSPMLVNDALTNPDNYLFNHGAYTTEVLVVNSSQVLLVVENLFEQDTFTAEVNGIYSATHELIDPDFNSYTFVVSRPNMPTFALAVSSTNGRLKSGTQAIKLDESEDAWYIMTESGIDVIDRVSLQNRGFVLDATGFNAILIA